jgi:selenide,water dikinase
MAGGYLEEIYTEAEITVDLFQLCEKKGVRLIVENPVKLDIEGKSVTLEDGRTITFDLLSLDLDSNGQQMEGVSRFGIPIRYSDNLKKIKQHLMNRNIDHNLTIVGAGKLGVEAALSLRLLLSEHHQNSNITLIEAAQSVLPGYDLKAKKFILEELKQQRIELLLGRKVIRVTGDLLIFNDNSVLDYGYLIWTAKSIAYPVLNGTGLAVDEKGRLLVNPTLRTNKCDFIFASGESVAIQNLYVKMPEFEPDKQAELLLENIIHTLKKTTLRAYIPIENYKKVINMGNKRAVTQKHELVIKGGRGWRFGKSRAEKFIKQLQK